MSQSLRSLAATEALASASIHQTSLAIIDAFVVLSIMRRG